MASNDVEGRKHWDQGVASAGFQGDTSALWDAMVWARETSSFSLAPAKLAAENVKAKVFCDAVRGSYEGEATNEAILVGLLAMPRPCAWCSEKECWIWCEICGGCGMCCVEDFHCI